MEYVAYFFIAHGWWVSLVSILVFGFFKLPRWCSWWWILIPLSLCGATVAAWVLVLYGLSTLAAN